MFELSKEQYQLKESSILKHKLYKKQHM